MANKDDQTLEHCFFQEWMYLQKQDLSELVHGLTLGPDCTHRETELTRLVKTNIKHFEEYITKRGRLASEDVSAFFTPSWCTSLENSLLWIGGCRPSLFIRLVYALCGSELESRLAEVLKGERTGDLGELSAEQLSRMDSLQARTIRDEVELSGKMASLQEEIGDQPLALIANESSQLGELSKDAQRALDEHGKAMVGMLEEADQLRLSTLKELISFLTPIQSVDYLAAAKKLHLSMHMWGQKRDHNHGRN